MRSEGAGGRVKECEREVLYGEEKKKGANEWLAKR